MAESDLGSYGWDESRDKPPLGPDNRSAPVPDNSERRTLPRRFSCTSGNIRSVSATENRIRIYLRAFPPSWVVGRRSTREGTFTHPVSGGRYRLGWSTGTHQHPSSVVPWLNGETSVSKDFKLDFGDRSFLELLLLVAGTRLWNHNARCCKLRREPSPEARI